MLLSAYFQMRRKEKNMCTKLQGQILRVQWWFHLIHLKLIVQLLAQLMGLNLQQFYQIPHQAPPQARDRPPPFLGLGLV
ncbi:Protein Ycf2 [Frankliniella fusca]|uniref:Protein Ycf2 n=1 Tax=Frankliniella fusca TaxID=407009 RepID=A0AAE1LIQ6_9NEOP|nr:Protein Ycf2 [Frankliniella fusca]